MELAPETALRHFVLREQLGRGGMGVVWRAHDARLDRDVAIKLLPDAVAHDAERLARFEREARMLAALNHPGIAQCFGLHEDRGRRFIAMELVSGEDLHRVLRRGALGVVRSIELGLQVAAALEAAHRRGIVHRDLKPANIVVDDDGAAKVLDFGLARSDGAGTGVHGVDPANSPTRTVSATVEGTVLGTAAYMSPGQARGNTVGRDADLWAFGCVLYECLAGRPAFAGETVSDTLASVLRSEPDWDALPRATPLRLRELIRRCLAKDEKDRWRDAGDAALELRAALAEARDGSGDAGRNAAVPGWHRVGLVAAATLIVGAVAGALIVDRFDRFGREPTPPRVVRATLEPPAGWTPKHARISPDGRYVALVATGHDEGPIDRLFLRELAHDDEFVSLPIRLDDEPIAFSPDSSQLAFVAIDVPGVDGPALVRAATDRSSPPTFVARWDDRWRDALVWTGHDEIAVVGIDPEQLVRLRLDGGTPSLRDLSSDGIDGFLDVSATLPDGSILAAADDWDGGYHRDAVRIDVDTGRVERLVDRAFEPVYARGRLLFSRGDQLLAVPFELDERRAGGAPRVVADGLRAEIELTAGRYSVSDRGDLVHLEGGRVGTRRRLVWLHADGSATPWIDAPGPYSVGALDDSQDGSVVAAVRVAASGLFEIVAGEVDEPALRTALSIEGMDCARPVVSSGGGWIAGHCVGVAGRNGVYLAPFPSTSPRGRLIVPNDDSIVGPSSWSPDGRSLLLLRFRAGIGTAEIVPVEDGDAVGAPTPIEGIEGNVGFVMISPDDAFVAFTRWDGRIWVLHVAAWDGVRAGPARPVMRGARPEFDWTGVDRGGRYEIAALDERSEPKYVLLDRSGRLDAVENVRDYVRDAEGIRGVCYLADGRVLVLQADAAELGARGVRLITGWASRLD